MKTNQEHKLQNHDIDVVLYGKPGSEYEFLKAKMIDVFAARNCTYRITDSFDPKSFIEQNLDQIPAASINGQVIVRSDVDILTYIDEVIAAVDHTRQEQPFCPVLVPIDFSPSSRNALAYGADLAELQQGEVHMLHIEESLVVPGIDGVYITERPPREMEGQLGDWAATLSSDGRRSKVLVEHEVRSGIPASEIITKAHELGRPLIVLGSSGLGGRLETAFGSVTLRVMKRANCPVLIVPPSAGSSKPRKIAFCSHRYNESATVIHELLALANLFDAELHLLHFHEPNHTPNPKPLLEILKSSYPAEKISIHELKGQDPITSIEEYCISHGIDIVSLVRGHRGILEELFHKSWTRRLALHSTLPLFIWPS